MSHDVLQDHTPTSPSVFVTERDGFRYLHLGDPNVENAHVDHRPQPGDDSKYVQAAMLVRDPLAIQSQYVQHMMVWTLLRDPRYLSTGLTVQLGLGAGAMARFTHGVLHMKTLVVELNKAVINVCKTSFAIPDNNPLLEVLEMDAAAFVAAARNRGIAQVLMVDLYDERYAAPVLDSEEFYRQCRQALAPGGLMTVNLAGCNADFDRSASRIAAAFGYEQMFYMLPTEEGNSIVVALNGMDFPAPQTIFERVEQVEKRFNLPASQWLLQMKPFRPKAPSPALRF
jgi:spermidine synthase